MTSVVLKPVTGRQKAGAVAAAIRRYAVSKGPQWKLPTRPEMAEALQVALGTLDSALAQLERQGLIERRQGSGIYATEQVRQKTIGVVFGGDIFQPGFSPFWSLLLGAVRGQADKRQLLPRAYFDIAEGHGQLFEDLEARRLDGLLLFTPHSHYDEVAELRACGLPLVVFGDTTPGYGSVTFDWDRFLERAARELAATGCRRVGLTAMPAQQAKFANLLHDAGMSDVRLDDWSYETWASIIPGAGTRENCAHRLVERLLAERVANPLPDALVSLEDTATRGALTALHQAGLRPGRDLRIVTAENKGSPVLDPFAADITRITFDPADCVAAMLAMLETLIDGGTPEQNPVRIAPHGCGAGSGEGGCGVWECGGVGVWGYGGVGVSECRSVGA